jgi:two-component system, OmpR family, response regulator ChvI
MSKRILVVDDWADVSVTIRLILEQNGFEVDTFEDPISALKAFKPDTYDLLIIDIRMRDLNGFELYKKIKEVDTKVDVLFLTAISVLEEYEQYRKELPPQENERNFIYKPVYSNELVERVNEMITNS